MDTDYNGILATLVGSIAADGAAWALLGLVFIFGSYLSWQQQKNNARIAEQHARDESAREEAYVKRLDGIIDRYDRTLRDVTDLLGRNAELLRESTWVIRKATAALERSNQLIQSLEAAIPPRRMTKRPAERAQIPSTGQEKVDDEKYQSDPYA